MLQVDSNCEQRQEPSNAFESFFCRLHSSFLFIETNPCPFYLRIVNPMTLGYIHLCSPKFVLEIIKDH